MRFYRENFPHAAVLPKDAHHGRACSAMVKEVMPWFWTDGRVRHRVNSYQGSIGRNLGIEE